MNKRLLIFTICFFLTLSAFAQSTADEIESLLRTGEVTYAQAARFVLEAADINVMANLSQPFPNIWFEYAAQHNWLPKNVSANEAARLDGVSLLVMSSFGIKGGVLYSLVKNPHYAYRELVYQNIIFGRIDPANAVSGDDLLYIINRVFSQREEGNLP